MLKIFIIGGSSGIGQEIANQLQDNELWNFSSRECQYAKKNIKFDLRNKKDLNDFSKKVIAEKPDRIIFNSGIGLFGEIGSSSKKINDLFQINVIGYIEIIEQISKYLIKTKTKVLFTSSTAAYISGANEAIYNATKHALSAYCKSMQAEYDFAKSEVTIMEFVMHATNATNMTRGSASKEEFLYLKSVIFEMLNKFEEGETIFIPKYNEIYSTVFKKYFDNPIKQGVDSIEYKIKKGGK